MAPERQVVLDDEAYKTLRLLVDNRLARMSDNVSAYVEYIIIYERIAAALAQAQPLRPSATAPAAPPERGATAAGRAQRAKAIERSAAAARPDLPKLCPAHPKYGARRSPRSDCPSCWAAYEKYNGPSQAALARAAFDRKNRGGQEEDHSHPPDPSQSRTTGHNRTDLEGLAPTLPAGGDSRAQRARTTRKR